MQRVKQAQRVLSTYSVDVFGICSALYELGGLLVIHDASGCNSTYGTHNEPRWYDTPSMVYISGLREVDTIYGNDTRLVNDIVEVVNETKPAFTAVGGSPMPNAIGTDFKAVAKLIEKKTGIPAMGFRTDGIHSYLPGAGAAFRSLAERFLREPEKSGENGKTRVNLLGLTPLDFSVVGNVTEMKRLVRSAGLVLQSSWAMGDSLENLKGAASADVNAVVSSTGLPVAEYMYERFGIPYIIGIPMGKSGSEQWLRDLQSGRGTLFPEAYSDAGQKTGAELYLINSWKSREVTEADRCDVLLIGEPVWCASLSYLLRTEFGVEKIKQICPMADAPKKLLNGMEAVSVEDALRERCQYAKTVIADPIYARLLPDEPEKFISFPHEAYSGRHYREDIPQFVGPAFSGWLSKALSSNGGNLN